MFPDFSRAVNLASRPDVYELENRALDPDGLVLAAIPVADARLTRHPHALGLTYGDVLFAVSKPAAQH